MTLCVLFQLSGLFSNYAYIYKVHTLNTFSDFSELAGATLVILKLLETFGYCILKFIFRTWTVAWMLAIEFNFKTRKHYNNYSY